MNEALALYIHWPFCVSKCPYCDFNSHVRESVDQDRWRSALLADLAHEVDVGPKRPLTSIFFGGGTPSLMPPATVAALIEAAERHWGFAPGIEITLEANPSSVEASRFAGLAAAGVNRVSLGLQALDDAALQFLGRAHDVAEGLAALETAQRNFDRVSFDLIYALPGQAVDDWAKTLDRAIGLGTGHLSLYQLTIEPGTRFAAMAARGELAPQDPDLGADLFELTRALTTAAGLPAYEISNHARPGEESRHNLTYWRYGDYLGIGPGAHGRRVGVATTRAKKPENWLTRIDARGHGMDLEDALSDTDRARETLVMGLRLEEGIPLDRIRPAVDAAAVARLANLGLIEQTAERLRVTPQGMLVLNTILAEIAV
ncbi:radical SAM family heme chaperone HemW [Sphingomonas sp.]|uniref:radical SAM family heme chaperone HemW n=1 Tax=Sphingomonas sp. TaxID=28214 RepID=UPI003B3BBB1D